jgi:dUTP pyrophosphatase
VESGTIARVELEIQVLDPGLPVPSKPHEADAALDLFARIGVTLSSMTGARLVPTGIAVAIPDGHVGLICPRSGLAAQFGISVLNAPGIIDPGFRGELGVVLFSVNSRAKTLERGSRIAQLLVQPVANLSPRVVAELPGGDRGHRGFGSSGI